MKFKSVLMDEIAVERAIGRIAHEIIEHNKGVDNVVLIGIKTRGLPMAEKIKEKIYEYENKTVPVGALDITLYRDDLTDINVNPSLNGTDIPFDIIGKDLILVDDVIYTGRTARAALDAIIDIGRPHTVQLAVLIDRGHRELPIRADYCGKSVPTAVSEIISVKFVNTDGEQNVAIFTKE